MARRWPASNPGQEPRRERRPTTPGMEEVEPRRERRPRRPTRNAAKMAARPTGPGRLRSYPSRRRTRAPRCGAAACGRTLPAPAAPGVRSARNCWMSTAKSSWPHTPQTLAALRGLGPGIPAGTTGLEPGRVARWRPPPSVIPAGMPVSRGRIARSSEPVPAPQVEPGTRPGQGRGIAAGWMSVLDEDSPGEAVAVQDVDVVGSLEL
jgi:hypothetical protein